MNYSKVKINDLSYDQKTTSIMTSNSSNSSNSSSVVLLLIGSKMEMSDLSVNSHGLVEHLNLMFRTTDDSFGLFVNKLDNYFINKLHKKYPNVENKFVSSLRNSIYDDSNQENIYLRVHKFTNTEFYDSNKDLITDLSQLSSSSSRTCLTCLPLFKLSLKSLGNLIYIEWELLQIKLIDGDNNSTSTTCLILDEEEKLDI